MEIKKNILLPKSSFALADDEDVFISIQLNRTVTDIKNEKIDNVFNLNQQYDIERQNSLKFCIFGLVDSHFINTENIIINARDSSDLTLNLPKITKNSISNRILEIKTFALTPECGMSRNVYGKNKSAYSILFEIDKNELEASDAAVIKNGGIPKTHYINFTIFDDDRKVYFLKDVPYLFYDLEGNRVSFGTQSADVDDAGNVIEINNDFQFLYDRHWIKQYFDLPTPSYAFFPNTNVNTSENNPIETQIVNGLSAGTIYLTIGIDQPSPYGLEEVSVALDSDDTIRNPNLDYVFETTLVKWGFGEQYKVVPIKIYDDKYVESAETISFKLINLKSCLLKDLNSSKLKLTINDDDIPSQIRFLNNVSVIKSNVRNTTFTYGFDKPLEVPNQKVELYITSNTTAKVGVDFILDPNNVEAKSIIIDFSEGDIEGVTTIQIIDNDVYDLEKLIEIGFRNPTQNIKISNIGAVPDVGQVNRITIQDSINVQYSSYVFVNDNNKKIGPLRAFKAPVQISYDGVFSNSYYWNNNFESGFAPSTNYSITIINDGVDVVYNNEMIKANNTLTAITVDTTQIQNLKIELPSNFSYDKPNKKYTKTKYAFFISSNEKFVVKEEAFGNNNFFIQKDYNQIIINTTKDASVQNSKLYYFTTKLTNFMLNYKNTLSACTLDNTYDRIGVAYTNNLIFIGQPIHNTIYPYDSKVDASFEDTKISIQCSQDFPFGFGKLPNPPYKFKYIELDMRNIYPQSTPPISDAFNALRLDTPQTIDRGFIKWDDAPKNTKETMNLSILNNGEIAVPIMGSLVNPGEKFYISGLEKNLETFYVSLPTNESLQPSTSTFVTANYILSLENVSYFSADGLIAGTPSSFQFSSTNNLVSGPLSATPKYSIVTEYGNVAVPVINNGGFIEPIDCFGDNFFKNKLINVAIKGVLLPNSQSSFLRGYFVDEGSDINYTCFAGPSTRIPFKQI